MAEKSLSHKFGALVKKHRTKAGLSQEKLAERAGVHPTYISLIERCIRNPTLDVALRIAAALKLKLWQMIRDLEE